MLFGSSFLSCFSLMDYKKKGGSLSPPPPFFMFLLIQLAE